MPSRRTPNTALAALLLESGWTGQALADAVNTSGLDSDLALRYDRTSIAHWLSGSRPSVLVTEVVAEALTRRLGRRIGPGETGLLRAGDTGADLVGAAAQDVAESLVRLGAGAGRRTGQAAMIYTVGAPILPANIPAAALRPASGRGRVGSAQVQAATLMLSVFSDVDLTLGGGRARAALSTYLVTDVAVWLRASATPATSVRLWSIAARLAYLAGWMCFDDILHGAAQRYYRLAASLAADAGDAGCYTAALRGLSVQAHYLSHHSTALQLAEAAARYQGLPPEQAAFLDGQHAVTLAATGDARAALAHLNHAERSLARAQDATAVGGYHPAALAHQRAEVLAALGDRPGAIASLVASLRHRPATERRAHAITSARLAELYLDAGHLDQACTAWAGLLDCRPHLSSGRIDHAVRSLRARLRPHALHPAARTLLIRAAPQR
ncbi:hypothetical protein M8C13_38525 [Crossiella sp. SN42]|uniref:hypothetical protein n=1 Tax=Crossiella sp. SN42 TaxID=2944808 RepID=UPI00207C75D2|nr:hypothetical protein [Crossiella sp. SN42]MCO1581661.1 hypothetical protein [Crossiella sp. SN42]